MRVDPVIAALRGDCAPQRKAQTRMVSACDAWRAETAVARVLRELEAYGAGASLADCRVLETTMTSTAAARELTASFCRHFSGALSEMNLGHPPFRYGFDGRRSTFLLARSGRAQLTLHALEPGRADPLQVSFSDSSRHELVLAGAGRGRIVSCDRHAERASLGIAETVLGEGSRFAFDLNRQALQVTGIERRLVSLRLLRDAELPQPTRAYRLADGAFLGQAEGALRSSRQEMMLALLGRMGRADAAPEMATLACEEGRDALRWQALRECLALDTAEGFQALTRLSRNAGDPLAAPAGALRAQLVEAHPQLLELEQGACRA